MDQLSINKDEYHRTHGKIHTLFRQAAYFLTAYDPNQLRCTRQPVISHAEPTRISREGYQQIARQWTNYGNCYKASNKLPSIRKRETQNSNGQTNNYNVCYKWEPQVVYGKVSAPANVAGRIQCLARSR